MVAEKDDKGNEREAKQDEEDAERCGNNRVEGDEGRGPKMASDWAGCERTARSTRGGSLVRGSHCLMSWSVTQKHVTLSSAEAELMAAVEATAETIGLIQLFAEIGVLVEGDILIDSTAALAAVHRKGNGRMRHVRVGHVWIQELSEEVALNFGKVSGEVNPADLMMKNLTSAKIASLLAKLHQSGHWSSS